MRDQLRRRQVLVSAAGLAAAAGLAGCQTGRPEPEVVEVEAGETLVFEGHASRWQGLEPESIEGLANPTLVLEEGGSYEFVWENADGAPHDLQIQDETGNVVDGLVTDTLYDRGERTSLELTASEEMVTYVCRFHRSSQRGRLRVR